MLFFDFEFILLLKLNFMSLCRFNKLNPVLLGRFIYALFTDLVNEKRRIILNLILIQMRLLAKNLSSKTNKL